MASADAVRALRSLLRTTCQSPLVHQQRRAACTECLARRKVLEPRNLHQYDRFMARPAAGRKVSGVRRLATLADLRRQEYGESQTGPIAEYDARVKSGKLRNDEHQRSLVQALQDLHDMLQHYTPPKVEHPTIASLQPKKRKSFIGSFFGGGKGNSNQQSISSDLPKGLYMYGDVGSGKTMLMDLFYDTLPENIEHATRIHFHNFMQDTHKSLHNMKAKYGNDIDAIPFVAASIAEQASVLCFDEFQVTDIADAMILRRLIESMMAHGTVMVTTSNRHPTDLYKNGIQRESFVPCINLLQERLRVLNLDSTTDYRKIPRPPSGVYHHPLDNVAKRHADHWFRFLGDPENDPPHSLTLTVWGRDVHVPEASGKAARFTFDELMGKATGAADYIELARSFEAFIVTDVPAMDYRSRDLARRFITFIDAVYEARGKLVLTTAVPLTQLFMSKDEIKTTISEATDAGVEGAEDTRNDSSDVSDAMRAMMDDLGMNMNMLKNSSIFTGDEEAFAFARALSRLSEMGSQEWVERGMGLEKAGGKKEAQDWQKVRSHYHQDSYG